MEWDEMGGWTEDDRMIQQLRNDGNDAAADRIEALSAEVEGLREKANTLGDGYLDATHRAQQAEAKLAACEALAKRWEGVAERTGVRQFTGNDHLLFANELKAAMQEKP